MRNLHSQTKDGVQVLPMISKFKKLIALIRRMLMKVLIVLRLPLKVKAKIGDFVIIFHNAADSYITEQIAYHGFDGYEYELGKFIKSYPFGFKTFIDAGANIGFYSVLVRAIYGDDKAITAIEAFPNNVRYMEDLQRNNNIVFDIAPYALTEKTGDTREFYVPTTHRSAKLPPAASLINNFKGSGGIFDKDSFDIIEVKTISLSDIINQHEAPYLIKLDIEGYELPVLESVKEMLGTRDDIDLIVEIMINDKDKIEIFDLLIECGFKGYLVTNAGLIAEDRPLTLPYHSQKNGKLRTCWKNHYFTKKSEEEIRTLSVDKFGYFV